MTLIRPNQGQTTTEILRSLVGQYILLHVTVKGMLTSVCVNIEKSGSAGWRRKEQDKGFKLLLDSPPFDVTGNSLVLKYEDVNVLANNFHDIFETIPLEAVNDDGGVSVGNLYRDRSPMGQLLERLEQKTNELLAIHASLELPLDTPIHALYRVVARHEQLMVGDILSEYGDNLLTAFEQSQAIYAQVPQLRRFCGFDRIQHRPGPRGALLRFYMQHNPINPLNTDSPLDFIDYELKSLHISDSLTWTCQTDPRTESVDLLLTWGGCPVITEVKMAGDSFVSSAVVQLMYYASILANDRQQARLCGEFEHFAPDFAGWLCIIVEERDESKLNERGFGDDLQSTINFLRHEWTRNVMSPFYRGILVVRIEELHEPFCRERDIPAFQVINGGETVIDWRG